MTASRVALPAILFLVGCATAPKPTPAPKDPAGPSAPALSAANVKSGQWSPDGTRLLVRAESGGRGDLYIVPAAGGPALRLTAPEEPPLVDVTCQWSPDGAFVSYVDNTYALHVVRADGSGKQLAATGGLGPQCRYAWSPDGTRIAWIRTSNDADGNPLATFRCSTPASAAVDVDLLGGTVRHVHHLEWSPDSSRLAFSVEEKVNGNFPLQTVRPDGSDRKVLGPADSKTATLAWSPDGRQIAFRYYEGEQNRISVAITRPDGSGFDKLKGETNPGWTIDAFAWSPDARRLAFSVKDERPAAEQTAGCSTRLFTVRPDGAEECDVSGPFAAGGIIRTVLWAPDASRLAYTAQAAAGSEVELFCTSPGAGMARRVSGPLAPGEHVEIFSWSPASTHLSYFTFASVPGQAYVVAVDGTGPIRLPTNPEWRAWPPEWTRDGSRMIYTTYRSGAFGDMELRSVRADGRGAAVLWPAITPPRHVSWLRAPKMGSRIAFLSDAFVPDQYKLFITPADSPAAVPVF